MHISCVADLLCDVQRHQKTPLTGLPDVHGDEKEKKNLFSESDFAEVCVAGEEDLAKKT